MNEFKNIHEMNLEEFSMFMRNIKDKILKKSSECKTLEELKELENIAFGRKRGIFPYINKMLFEKDFDLNGEFYERVLEGIDKIL